MDKEKDINNRISKILKWKMRFLFKSTLDSLESETKFFNIDEKFFDKEDKLHGIGKIRKILFDNGNSLLELNDIILSEIEIIPNKSVVILEEKVLKDIENDKR